MKKIVLTSLLGVSLLLAGCGDTAPSSSSAVVTPVPTEIKDPLIELLSETTPAASYQLTKDAFLAKAKAENGIIIDLRMPSEIAKVPMIDSSAKNIDFYETQKMSEYFKTADKSASYFLYDSNGSRAESTYKALTGSLFNIPKVYVLKGGIENASK